MGWVKIKDILKFSLAYVLSLVLKKFSKFNEIWIITERKSEAKDNGYHFFRYMRNNHPEIQTYYAIEKSSAYLMKVEKYENVIFYNSFKHYLYAILAVNLVGAFLPVGIPDSMSFYKFGNRVCRAQKVFLQHGITKENMPMLHADKANIDLFICGAKPEYDYVSLQFGYKCEQVKYTGFSRFDALMKYETKNTILLMPTWRQYLPSTTWMKDETESIKKRSEIMKSEYFRAYQSLIDHPRLLKILKKYGYQIVFYPHHEVQWMLDCFKRNDDLIILASEENYDVQELLKESKVLITDYSSVAFDFAYMNKALIYFQFDKDEYDSKHYQKGYFDYKEHGFGKVCFSDEELIDELEGVLNKNCVENLEYQEKVEKFFTYRDGFNCERIYNAITERM